MEREEKEKKEPNRKYNSRFQCQNEQVLRQRRQKLVIALINNRKCTVPVVASNGKYGSCPQGTRFQPPNQLLTLYLGQSLLGMTLLNNSCILLKVTTIV